MSKRNSELPKAAVTRLAHVKSGFRVQQSAVEKASLLAEDYIKSIFTGALQFTEHREGTMILEKDVEAYLKSLETKN